MRRAANRWPVMAALVLAWPVGAVAADPVFNSGDLLMFGVAALFVIGVRRG